MQLHYQQTVSHDMRLGEAGENFQVFGYSNKTNSMQGGREEGLDLQHHASSAIDIGMQGSDTADHSTTP